jgi:hypothetical protein
VRIKIRFKELKKMNKIAKNILNQTKDSTGLKSKFCLVLGLQWGQEGKKKLLNKLCDNYDWSCRFNGGITSEPGNKLTPTKPIS